MNRTNRTLATMLGGLAAVALAIASPAAWADDDDDDDDEDDMEISFDEHEIFFELNYTDQDLGIPKIAGHPRPQQTEKTRSDRVVLRKCGAGV